MLDVEELRAEVYRKHGKRIDADDPIFMTVTMHQFLLSLYLEQYRTMQEIQLKELRDNLNFLLEKQETICTELLNRTLIKMNQNHNRTQKEFLNTLEKKLEAQKDGIFFFFKKISKFLRP